MRPEEALLAFTSGDAGAILKASSEVMNSDDPAFLTALLDHRDAIRNAAARVNLGGMLIPNSLQVRNALQWLDLWADRRENGPSRANCYCRLFGCHPAQSPESLERKGRAIVSIPVVDREAYQTTYQVLCPECRSRWESVEQEGWHVPTYEWRELS